MRRRGRRLVGRWWRPCPTTNRRPSVEGDAFGCAVAPVDGCGAVHLSPFLGGCWWGAAGRRLKGCRSVLAGTWRCGLWAGVLEFVGYWRGLTRRVVTFRWGLFRSAFKAQGREVAAAHLPHELPRCLCRFHGSLGFVY